MSTIIVLAALGLVLIVAEMFLPGLILGLVGVGLLIGAITVGYIEYGAVTGSVILMILLTVAIILFALWMKFFQKTSVGRGLMLGTTLTSGSDLPCSEDLVGKSGIATTDLRPSGRAEIAGDRYDVLSDTGFILRDQAVSVVRVEGNRIIVRKNL